MKKLFKLASLSSVLLPILLIGMLSIGPACAIDGGPDVDGEKVDVQINTVPDYVEQKNAGQGVIQKKVTGQVGAGQENTGQEYDGQGNDGQENTGQEYDGQGNTGAARSILDDFSGDLESLQLQFTQVVKSQDGSIQDQTGGHATLQNPDMLYWVYEGDFPETIVADGQSVWIYDEALDQVTVRPQSASISDTPLMILTDISQLDETFLVTELGDFENMQLLELRSRDEESEFERIIIGLDVEGIKMMVMEDAYGQRTEIRFSDIVKNAEIDTGLFNFVPPDGVDVVGEMPEPQ